MGSGVQQRQWRTYPQLKGHFLAEDADELWVIAHDGGPCLTDCRPEAVLVKVTGSKGKVFTARVLHEPIQLRTVRLGQEIRFIVSKGCKQAVLVTQKYLTERGLWTIEPCQKCGFDELFDAPSDLGALFLHASSIPAPRSFKTRCPLCGGIQVVAFKHSSAPGSKRSTQKKAGGAK